MWFSTALGEQTAVAVAVKDARLALTVEEIGDRGFHRAVEPDALLDDLKLSGDAFILRHVLGEVVGRVARHLEANRAVVDADSIADFAAEQFVDRQGRPLYRPHPRAPSRPR